MSWQELPWLEVRKRRPRKGNGAYSLSDAQLQGVSTCSLPRPQAMINLTQIIWQMLIQPILKNLRDTTPSDPCFASIRQALEFPIGN